MQQRPGSSYENCETRPWFGNSKPTKHERKTYPWVNWRSYSSAHRSYSVGDGACLKVVTSEIRGLCNYCKSSLLENDSTKVLLPWQLESLGCVQGRLQQLIGMDLRKNCIILSENVERAPNKVSIIVGKVKICHEKRNWDEMLKKWGSALSSKVTIVRWCMLWLSHDANYECSGVSMRKCTEKGL